ARVAPPVPRRDVEVVGDVRLAEVHEDARGLARRRQLLLHPGDLARSRVQVAGIEEGLEARAEHAAGFGVGVEPAGGRRAYRRVAEAPEPLDDVRPGEVEVRLAVAGMAGVLELEELAVL